MVKFELTDDQKVIVGCTAVVAVVGAAVIIQDQSTKNRLAKTMRKTQDVVDILLKLDESVKEGNAKLDAQRQSLIDSSANIAKAMSIMSKGGDNV